uniref:Zinc finger protein 511 n=1 Tax=Anas platyrhynchos platyrhynchos TaxID=8840 RepID=U3J3D7_ANAPP
NRSERVSEFCCHISGCSQVFDTLEGYEHHYNTLHRNVCSFCKRSFPSGHLLDIHILEWHDSLFQIMAEKQNMYKCLVEGCTEKFKSSKDRKDHLVTIHLYPADFRFGRPKKVKSMETSEQFQVDPMEVGPSERMEIPQPAASPSPTVPEKRLYKSRSVPLAFTGKNFQGWDRTILISYCNTAQGVSVSTIKEVMFLFIFKSPF